MRKRISKTNRKKLMKKRNQKIWGLMSYGGV